MVKIIKYLGIIFNYIGKLSLIKIHLYFWYVALLKYLKIIKINGFYKKYYHFYLGNY